MIKLAFLNSIDNAALFIFDDHQHGYYNYLTNRHLKILIYKELNPQIRAIFSLTLIVNRFSFALISKFFYLNLLLYYLLVPPLILVLNFMYNEDYFKAFFFSIN